jgi:hypothetical protein
MSPVRGDQMPQILLLVAVLLIASGLIAFRFIIPSSSSPTIQAPNGYQIVNDPGSPPKLNQPYKP